LNQQREDTEIEFEITSPLVRAMLMSSVIPLLRRPLPFELPPISWGDVDMRVLLLTAMRFLDRQGMLDATNICHKRCLVDPFNGQSVWHEFAHLFDLVAVLKSWLPTKGTSLACEFKRETSSASSHMTASMRGDLVIETVAGRCVVELLASGTSGEVKEHFMRLDTYARAMGAKEAWLVHFTVGADDQPGLPSDLVDTPRPYKLHALHIQHDLAFARATVFLDSMGKERERIDGVCLGSTSVRDV
jgi:hypothetical protein